MTTDQDVLRGHQFDDIAEFDNRLPNWWLWSFYLACIFSFFYWLHFQVLKTGPSSQEEFRAEMAQLDAQVAGAAVSDEALLAKVGDPAAIAAGQAVFSTNCAACHGGDGGAVQRLAGQPPTVLPGANLTDKFWIHGGKPSDIYRTIMQGVPNTVMVAWGTALGAARSRDAAVYVLSLRNTNVKDGKEAQGQEYLESEAR